MSTKSRRFSTELSSVLLVCCLVAAVNSQETTAPPYIEPDCTAREFPCTLFNSTVGECNTTTGNCSCNSPPALGDCFVWNETVNLCQEQKCYFYLPQDGTCRKGSKSRVIALLLSIFLINFGAANFYIEIYSLAIAQIILGLSLCVFQFGSCAVAGTRDGETTPPCIICCSINSFLSLLFLAWWIADLVIFATNQRLDRTSCPLY